MKLRDPLSAVLLSTLLSTCAVLPSFAGSPTSPPGRTGTSDALVGAVEQIDRQTDASKTDASKTDASQIEARQTERPVTIVTPNPKQAPQLAKDQSVRRPRVALALGGGGTRGAAHVGVLKVLADNGIPIDCIVGTSMGAIVGGLYSAGIPLDELMKRFENGHIMRTFMTVPLSVRLAAAPILILPRVVGYHPYDGLYKGNRFRKYLNATVPEYERQIEDLHIPFRAVVLNLVDGKPYALNQGNLGYALQASSAVPGLRKPVQIGQNLYVDGGVVVNLPVSFARELNPDILIAVDVDERFEPVPLKTFTKIGSVSKRIVTLQLASIDKIQCKDADVLIHPNVDGIGLVSTSPKDARRALESGEKAALEALPLIKQKLAELGIEANAPGIVGPSRTKEHWFTHKRALEPPYPPAAGHIFQSFGEDDITPFATAPSDITESAARPSATAASTNDPSATKPSTTAQAPTPADQATK